MNRKPSLRVCKKCGFLSSGSSCFLKLFSRVFLSIPRGRLGGLAGNACEEFEDSEGGVELMFLRVLVLAHLG